MNFSLILDSWIALGMAILFGVLGSICLKLSNGLRNRLTTCLLAIFYTISFVALTFAVKYIDLSVVYAVWSGAGTVLMVAVGVIFFEETFSLRKMIYLGLILIGVIGMHVNV